MCVERSALVFVVIVCISDQSVRPTLSNPSIRDSPSPPAEAATSVPQVAAPASMRADVPDVSLQEPSFSSMCANLLHPPPTRSLSPSLLSFHLQNYLIPHSSFHYLPFQLLSTLSLPLRDVRTHLHTSIDTFFETMPLDAFPVDSKYVVLWVSTRCGLHLPPIFLFFCQDALRQPSRRLLPTFFFKLLLCDRIGIRVGRTRTLKAPSDAFEVEPTRTLVNIIAF